MKAGVLKMEKKKLKGKCRKCLGCNLLEYREFNGRKHCKYFVRADNENIILAVFIILQILIMLGIFVCLYYKFSILCGG